MDNQSHVTFAASPVNDVRYDAIWHAGLLGDVTQHHPTSSQLADPAYRFCGMLAVWVSLSARVVFSAFRDHIPGIVFVGTKKQVRRIAARRVVAVVQNQCSGNVIKGYPVVKRIPDAVRAGGSAPGSFRSMPRKEAVVLAGPYNVVPAAGPHPARAKPRAMLRHGAVLVDLRPKADAERLSARLSVGYLGIIHELTPRGSVPRASDSAAGHGYYKAHHIPGQA